MDPKAFKPAAKMIPKQTAYETRKNGTTCYFVVPEKYGGNFDSTE